MGGALLTGKRRHLALPGGGLPVMDGERVIEAFGHDELDHERELRPV
jgi:hypothetical protein